MSRTFFRLLLRAYPRDFRLRYGDEMEAAFAACAERERGRPLAVLRIAVRALIDTVRHGWQMRADERRGRGWSTSAWHDARTMRNTWMNGLDLKLAARMLAKYPGLTVIGGLAMAFATWVGVVAFSMVVPLLYPSLPLPEGDRIVQIENLDTAAGKTDKRILHDFAIWRDSLRSITDLGVWRDSPREVMISNGDPRRIDAAEMTASGFRVASAEPLLGRALVAKDEQPGAPLVAVIGYDLWQTRFGSDPSVLGRELKVGTETATIVGVMRQGFAFPVAHELWLPLRLDLLEQAPRSGPHAWAFGLLAPGASRKTAQAELGAIGRRLAAERPATHQHIEPLVSAYGTMADEGEDLGIMFSMYFFIALLLILVCGNVGLLLFARAASRETDFLVRTALGATRGRIVSQMFAEALVLGGLAAVVGVIFADIALQSWGKPFIDATLGRLPFWVNMRVSPGSVMVALGLAVIGAGIAGIVPALKITRGINDRLKQTTSGAGGLRFGGIWTALIVVQVAVTVAFPPLAYWEQSQLRHIQNFDMGFAADQYLTVRIERGDPVDSRSEDAPLSAERAKQFASAVEELRTQVAAQSGVAGVTLAEQLPGTNQSQAWIEVASDAMSGAPAADQSELERSRIVTVAVVHPSYFDVLEAPVSSGRGFTLADAQSRARVAIVDEAFVDRVLNGRNPIGQQVRFASRTDDSAEQPWYEVVGVVKNVGAGSPFDKGQASGYYLPATPDAFDDVFMLVHVRAGDPMTFASRVRDIAHTVSPSLHLGDFQRANHANDDMVSIIGLWQKLTLIMSGVALLLSLAGIYAVFSFAASRRTLEIGVRVALGARPSSVVAAIFRGPLFQVKLGIGVGTGVMLAIAYLLQHTQLPGSEQGLTLTGAVMFLCYGAIMLGVCLLACVVPARRALKVDPTVALRME